eukprot:scaffold140261_cov45-Prasinocladus_malaysianus.AAC.1
MHKMMDEWGWHDLIVKRAVIYDGNLCGPLVLLNSLAHVEADIMVPSRSNVADDQMIPLCMA